MVQPFCPLYRNSSYHELSQLSPSDQLELLHVIHSSKKPIWLTEAPQDVHSEVERAGDWLTSLGYSARSGFHVYFRELMEEELYEPSLSFYMALLFKNLVGERVLPVENISESSQTDLFAHCTSLRHTPIQGAITLYGANMNEEPAKLLLRLSDQEEGGELMKFILKNDNNGNIIVNGQEMSYEGDIRPVVKRIQPCKTLVLNLPPKSFGFWVLANTSIEACRGINEAESVLSETDIINEIDNTNDRRKRSIHSSLDNDLVMNLRSDLKNHIEEFKDFSNQFKKISASKVKRHINDEPREINKTRRQLVKSIKGPTVLDIVDKVLSKYKLRKYFRLNKNKHFTKEGNCEGTEIKASRAKRHILNVKNDLVSSLSNSDGKSMIENPTNNLYIDHDAKKPSGEVKKDSLLVSGMTPKDNRPEILDDSNNSDIKIDLQNDSISFKIKSLFETAIVNEAAKALMYVAEKMKELAQKTGMD